VTVVAPSTTATVVASSRQVPAVSTTHATAPAVFSGTRQSLFHTAATSFAAPTSTNRQPLNSVNTSHTSDITDANVTDDGPNDGLNKYTLGTSSSSLAVKDKASGVDEDVMLLWAHVNQLVIYGLHMSTVCQQQREFGEFDMLRQMHDFAHVWMPIMEQHILPLKPRWPIDKDVCNRLPHFVPQNKADDPLRMRDLVRLLATSLRNQLRSALTLTRDMLLVASSSSNVSLVEHESMDTVRTVRDQICKLYSNIQFALQWIQQLFIEFAPEALCGLGLQQEIDRRMRTNPNQLQSSTDFVHFMGIKKDRTFFTGEI